MEQIQPVSDAGKEALAVLRPERTWDPEKATKRKVRVIKVPYDQDPMKEKTIFEYQGFVYICYSKKTRGRSMIRCLGLAEVEGPPKKKQTPFESGKLLDGVKTELDGDAFGDAIKEAIDDEKVQQVIKEVTGEGEKEAEVGD